MVDENMASAARVHAVERGKSFEERTLVAFGGAAPLHATRIADKLGIRRVVVPTAAGVGSAVGMLTAPVAYEVARSLYQRVRELDPARVNAHFEAMQREAHDVVAKGASATPLVESRAAYMRYIGQGHEIAVPLAARAFDLADRQRLQEAFEREYRAQFGRIIPDLEAEVLSWALSLSTRIEPSTPVVPTLEQTRPTPTARRRAFDEQSGGFSEVAVFRRAELASGARIEGPALVVEDETTTVVAPGFQATVNAVGYLMLERTQARQQERST
jgi:N-methylhydantoinase A